ncbi:WYL domain-containing protein [Pseudoalteromonas sp. T1lg75]|uniref:WYL domain-containing protein n=1 Tax=Pseudoalteromonas sp. T1lg75 TaxID=2077102 RepID=UPI000CF67F31|nr:WYL domain-containing protein [Pseudoalteromonas sp. T1lg75]
MQLENLNHAQRERLAFIDFSLEFFGQIARADLIQKFGTGLASCTRDLSLYRELAPDNAVLMHENKRYVRSDVFRAIFEHDPESTLRTLAKGFGDGFSLPQEKSSACFDAIRLVHPNAEIISAIMRAIYSNSAIKCEYESLSSGETKRELVPHAIVNNGHRWHVRAYDRKSKAFRDFVCTRFKRIELQETEPKSNELVDMDSAWNSLCELQLVPHPRLPHSKAIEMDYGMTKGMLRLEVRAALANYLLRQWNVDCTDNATLTGDEYQLYLKNKNSLVDLIDFSITPGQQLN